MALQKLVLKPGINKEGTNYSNENGFYFCDKIRFRSGYAEKIGGWQNIGTYTYQGIARSLWAWVSLSAESLLGVGTTQKFYIEYGTKYYDITPINTSVALDSPYFSTTNASLLVTVTSNGHGVTEGTFVTFTKAYTTLSSDITSAVTSITLTSTTGFAASGSVKIDQEVISYTSIVGSTLTGCTRGASSTTPAAHLSGATVISLEAISVGGIALQGEFQIVKVTTGNTYQIVASSPATSTTTGGSGTKAIYDISASTGTYTSLSGWGSGFWGGITGDDTTGWGSGTATTTAAPIRLWSQTNYDQDLIFAPRFGAIYWWTKNTNAFPRAITLNAQANKETKIATTAQWRNSTTSIVVTDTTGIDTGAVVVDGTGIPTGSYVATTWNYSTTIPLIDPATGTAAVLTNAQTTLAANINASALSITLTSGTGFPSSNGIIIIGTEEIFYTTRVGNVLTIPATGGRGYNGTTAATHNSGDPVYNYTPTAVTFSYAGRHIPVKTLLVATSSSNAFTIAFGATPYDPYNFSSTANFDPLLIRWSDQDNPFEWVPLTTNQSGEQRLSNGSVIVAAANTRQEILVWTDTAIYSMQYLGPPYVWGINLLMDNLSIASQNAAITVNNVTYWMGVDRFYQYSGRVDTLPCTLRQFVFGNINRSQLSQICCGTNEGFNEIWWFYPSANSLVNDRYVVYNHLEDVWYYGTMNRSAWLDTQLEQNPLGVFSTETTYLANAITSSDTSILLLDASSFPSSGTVTIESEQISYTSINYSTNYISGCIRGVNNTTAASHIANQPVTFTTPNQLMFHEYGWDDVSNTVPAPIVSYIQSSDFDIGDGLNFAYVWRILPDLTFSRSTVSNPIVYLRVKVRQNSGTEYTVHPVDVYTDNIGVVLDSSAVPATDTEVEQFSELNSDGTIYPINPLNRGQVYTRVRGRQMAFQMKSVDLGVFWQMGMMRIDVRQDGRR